MKFYCDLDGFTVYFLALLPMIPEKGADFMRNMVLSPAAAATFRCAATLARAYGHGYVGSEHLLLAMLVRTESAAGKILLRAGVYPAQVLAKLEQHAGRGQGGLLLAQEIGRAHV